MIRLADYVFNRLLEYKVRHVFFVSGGQCVYLTDALRRNSNIEAISMHHEQSVAMAALSYATMNETLGVGLVTTGCAGTNTITGILHAWQDSIPMIIISGQQNYEHTVKHSGLPLRQVGIQEADIETIVSPITKYAVTIENPEDIAWHLDKALYEATTGRKGPVWIDLPLNVQNTMIDEDKLQRFIPKLPNNELSEDILLELSQLISNSKRPVLLVGNGVRSAKAKRELAIFAHKTNIPVVFSRLAYDILPFDDYCNFGVIGGVAGANRYSNFIVQNSDLVLSIGSRLSIEVTGSNRKEFAREAKIIVVDIDRIEHLKESIHIDKFINADAKNFLEKIIDLDFDLNIQNWIEKCKHWKQIFAYPQEYEDTALIDSKIFMTQLSRKIEKNVVYVSDAGFTGATAPAATELKEGDRFVLALSQGEMGFALPASCGIASFSENLVISYNGDGSIMMNLQELQTIVRNNFNIKIIIMNNNGYSGVRHGQKAHFRGKSIGTDASNGLDFPSYEKIAIAFGIRYVSIHNYSEMMDVITEITKDDLPLICEVFCDPEQIDLHNGLVMYGKRKFGFRPIEDQSPYIDRDLFFKEMIVKPLETSFGKPM